jgi:HK97 family phage portal protein
MNEQMYAFEESLFENKARTGGVVENEENYSQETIDRLRMKWREMYAGVKKSGETLFLPKGMKFRRDAITPEEMSFIEGKKITREEICASFNIPIGALTSIDVNRTTAEASDYHLMRYGILPACRRIQEKMNEKLLPMFDERLFVAFDNPVPEDKEFELKRRREDTAANITLINEERKKLGLEPTSWGDEAWFSTMLAPYGGGEAGVAEGKAADALAAAAKRRLKEMLGA